MTSLATGAEVLANEFESKCLTRIGNSWFSGHGFGGFPETVQKGATANLCTDSNKKARTEPTTEPENEPARMIKCSQPI